MRLPIHLRRGWRTYIVRAEKTRLYKIGKAVDISARFKELGLANADALTLVASIDADVEYELHQTFAPFRHHGEWFEESPALLLLLDRIRTTQEFDLSYL
jgi:hypothetical protein